MKFQERGQESRATFMSDLPRLFPRDSSAKRCSSRAGALDFPWVTSSSTFDSMHQRDRESEEGERGEQEKTQNPKLEDSGKKTAWRTPAVRL